MKTKEKKMETTKEKFKALDLRAKQSGYKLSVESKLDHSNKQIPTLIEEYLYKKLSDDTIDVSDELNTELNTLAEIADENDENDIMLSLYTEALI